MAVLIFQNSEVGRPGLTSGPRRLSDHPSHPGITAVQSVADVGVGPDLIKAGPLIMYPSQQRYG